MTDAASWPRRALTTAHLAALAAVERRIPFWPPARVERLQRWRLRSIVRHAFESVPYYRETMRQLGLRPADFRTATDLARLPLLDGATVRRDPERFASDRYDDRSRYAYHTGGSRRHVSKLIYWDHATELSLLARSERDRVVLAALVGQLWGPRQLYLFAPTTLTMEVRNRWDTQTLQGRRLAQRHRLSPDLPFATVAAEIDAFRPQVIFSYGSYVDQFARFLADHGRDVALPRVWVYGGDMLSPAGRELIESRGVVVYSTYQAAETGRLGFECERRDGFHLNVDLCAVRIVDDARRDAAPGETGEVVISNLHNRATVLLNYQLGDQAALAAAPCPCGRSLPLLARLEGRTSELVTLADGRVLTSLACLALFQVELRTALMAQVVHPAPGDVRWRIVPFAGADPAALRRQIVDRARAVFGEGTSVEVEFVADVPRRSSGKVANVVPAEDDIRVEPAVIGLGTER